MEIQNVTPAGEAPGTPAEPIQETAEQRYARLYTQPAQAPAAAPAPPPPTPVVDTTIIESLKEELANIKKLVTPQAPAPQPLTPWFEELKQGNWEKAEADLISRVRGQVLAEAKQQAVAESNEALKVQIAVDRYLAEMRSQNADIAPMERYIEAPVANRVRLAQEAGKIRTSDDFIREYKSAVDAEVQEIRKLTGQYRAAGQQVATTRQKEILAATPLSPQAVTPPASEPGQPQTPPVETAEDYFTRRRTLEAMRKKLIV